MSEEHVSAVFGPPYVRQAKEFYRRSHDQQGQVIVALRRLLREHDPSLPDVYDGTAWQPIEAAAGAPTDTWKDWSWNDEGRP